MQKVVERFLLKLLQCGIYGVFIAHLLVYRILSMTYGGVNPAAGGETLFSTSAVQGQGEPSGIIHRQRIAGLKRIEPDIMSPHALKQRSFICDSPGFDVGFQPIGDLHE